MRIIELSIFAASVLLAVSAQNQPSSNIEERIQKFRRGVENMIPVVRHDDKSEEQAFQ
jgi:hypothetical protein